MATTLPDWLDELLPPERPVQVLRVTDDDITITLPDGSFNSYASLREADAALRESDFDTQVEDERTEADGVFGRSSVSFPVEKGYVGMIFTHTDADRRRGLERDYEQSQRAIRRYRADPENFVNAWIMLDTHPAFWTLSVDYEKAPWHWNTSGYCSKLRQYVYADRNRGTVVRLEAGSHVPTKQNFDTGGEDVNYLEHYGDWRLELEASSFEEAILALAHRVSICFNPDGTDREGATEALEDFKPEWVTELEARMEDEGK